MEKTSPFKIRAACRRLFNEEPETVVPRLITELGAPHRVAEVLDVSPTAARSWLLYRGWRFDGVQWVEPEAEHAPEAV